MDQLHTIPVGASSALVLNGALAGDEEVDAIAHQVAAQIDRLGLEAQTVTLREVQVAPCLGCFDCWTVSPGVCKTRDAARDLACAFVRSRLVAYVTPVTFGGYSSELKKAIDRMICVELPFFSRVGGEVHHRPRYDRRPALLVVGVLRDRSPAQARIFHELARRNAINQQAPAFASHVLTAPRAAGEELDHGLRRAIQDVFERAGAPLRLAAARGGAR